MVDKRLRIGPLFLRLGFFFEKHKIFLYKEDILKFTEALQETIDYLKNELMPEYDFTEEPDYNKDDELKWE